MKWHDVPMSPRFLTLSDVADTLNLSMSAARALVSSGELPAIQVGGKRVWRIEDTALEKYIEDQYAVSRERIRAHAAD
jgi:excisionase family DNA binding protein